MIFRKFFAKNFKYYLEKGDKYLEEARYADARGAYLEAVNKLGDSDDPVSAEAEVKKRIAETGKHLALLNLNEAEYALNRGDSQKVAEHLALVREFSEDENVLKKTVQFEQRMTTSPPLVQNASVKPACSGCRPEAGAEETGDPYDSRLVTEDRFEFLIQTLPGNLAKRYAVMGDKFARAYLAVHEGDERTGLLLYDELMRDNECDIILYETAILHYRSGKFSECERMLKRAIELNPENELTYLGLVQLLVDSGRAAEAIPLLGHMIEEQLLENQAMIMLADVYLLMKEEDKAMETLFSALAFSTAAKAAAERLVPLLEQRNRNEEATYLRKNFMKGCC